MSWLTYAARRVAFAALAAFLAVSLTFLVVAYAPNTDLGAQIALMQRGGATEAEIEAFVRQYRAERGLTGSLLDQYVRYMHNYLTLNWGYSVELGEPVKPVVAAAVPRTLGYMIPGVLAAYALGVAGGLAAVYGGRVQDWTARLGSYVAFGVPTMVVGVAAVTALSAHLDWLASPVWPATPFMALGAPSMRGVEPWLHVTPKYLLPAGVLAVGLFSGLLRHTRNSALDFRGSPRSKMLAAKGASNLQNARHALRNAALPLLSVSFAELMSVLALGAFVIETIFCIPGVAAYTLVGVYTRDFRLLVGTTIVFALIGITGSLLQDLLYGYLDPRISADE